MKTTIYNVWLGLCVVSLSACTIVESSESTVYEYPAYSNNQMMPRGYYVGSDFGRETNYNYNPGVQPTESYYVGPAHSPASFKDRDKTWVTSQNPQGYTIEVADDEKASHVAKKLHQLPKNDRMAEIKYQRNGKGYYKGIYGNYESQEAAQKALDALPAEVKAGAAVKNWGSVQGNIAE